MDAQVAGRFLLVEDDPLVRRNLARTLRRRGETMIADSVAAAERELDAHPHWAAFLIDSRLPDGSGLDMLARARVRHPCTPAMVLSGWMDAERINQAFDLNAHFVTKPVQQDRILRFLDDALTSSAPSSSRIERAATGWIARYRLSDAESDVLRRAALGQDRRAIVAARGSSDATLKTQIASLMLKTRDASLNNAVARLLREAATLRDAG